MPWAVCELMTESPRAIHSELSVAEAATLMRADDVGARPVVDQEDVLVGVITDRDVAVRVAAERRDPALVSAGEVASRELATVRPDQELGEALELMATRQVRRLPVVDERGHLVGIIAQADIAREIEPSSVGDLSPRAPPPSLPESSATVASVCWGSRRSHAFGFRGNTAELVLFPPAEPFLQPL